jgi:hypothetical protein
MRLKASRMTMMRKARLSVRANRNPMSDPHFGLKPIRKARTICANPMRRRISASIAPVTSKAGNCAISARSRRGNLGSNAISVFNPATNVVFNRANNAITSQETGNRETNSRESNSQDSCSRQKHPTSNRVNISHANRGSRKKLAGKNQVDKNQVDKRAGMMADARASRGLPRLQCRSRPSSLLCRPL